MAHAHIDHLAQQGDAGCMVLPVGLGNNRAAGAVGDAVRHPHIGMHPGHARELDIQGRDQFIGDAGGIGAAVEVIDDQGGAALADAQIDDIWQ